METKYKEIDEINDFGVTVKVGEDCEAKIVKDFRPIFAPILSRIYYKDNPALQKIGCDGFIQPQQVLYDIKCRRFVDLKYVGVDILLETVSVIEKNKPGWVYYTKSPIVAYFWLNISMSAFLDGYILYMDEIRKFFVGNENKYRKPRDAISHRNGTVWHTENRVVKIEQFPIGSIQHISKEAFTPKEQTLLSKYIKGFVPSADTK